MGQKEKLIERLKAMPKTFTFDGAESLPDTSVTTDPIRACQWGTDYAPV